MIRRRAPLRRSPLKRGPARPRVRGASSASDLALPKGETRPQAKARADRTASAKRKRVLRYVHQRDLVCRACGAAGVLFHVHEEPPRSLGGDPLNTRHCLLLCDRCHGKRHPKLRGGGVQELWIVITTDKGTDGPLTMKEGEREWESRPRGPVGREDR